MRTSRIISEELDAKWSRLASSALRALIARKDTTSPQLAQALRAINIDESDRSVEGKIARGTYPFAFFLQSLVALGADCPALWRQCLDATPTFETAAAAVMQKSMEALPGLAVTDVAMALSRIGTPMPGHFLERDAASGTFSFKVYLQCAAALGFPEATRFVDASDLSGLVVAGLNVRAA
jgi:hypothetical protein